MPVARSNESRRAVLVAVTGIVAAAVLVAVALYLNRDSTTLPTAGGGGAFVVGEVDALLDLGAGEAPACFNDPAAGDRPVCVFHTGPDDDEGWVAFDAQRDGEPLTQDRETGVLSGPDGDVVPPDGGDQPQYATEVRNGRVEVDLGRAPGEIDPDADADADETTTTTIRITGNPEDD